MDEFAKELWDMKLLEIKESKDGLWTITRVQGGWIYRLTHEVTSPVFVPLDNEFTRAEGTKQQLQPDGAQKADDIGLSDIVIEYT